MQSEVCNTTSGIQGINKGVFANADRVRVGSDGESGYTAASAEATAASAEATAEPAEVTAVLR